MFRVWTYALLAVCFPAAAIQVTDLKCEYVTNPLGIGTASPRLFWVLKSNLRGDVQTAYQVLAASSPDRLKPGKADFWDSGKVMTPVSIQVEYQGKSLRSGTRVYWTVRAWDQRGRVSRFAAPAWYETTLLSQADWKAEWITDHRENEPADPFSTLPAPLLRKEFVLDKKIQRARLYVSGLGCYEMNINGKRVGDHVLEPGWTKYSKRVLFSTYDVTGLLRGGTNAIGAMLGNGWYNPLPLRFWGHLNVREHLTIGQPRLIAQLHVIDADGRESIVATDATWRTSEGPVLRNNLYLGETYDARKEIAGWDQPGFDDSGWRAARLAFGNLGPLKAQEAPPIRVTRELKARTVTEPKPGVFIFDLGQNFAGWVRLRVKGAAGTVVKLRYGELLYGDGTLNGMTAVCGQIKGGGRDYEYPGEGYPKTAWQQDTYILKGDPQGEEWSPRFTFHGFRYVEVKGFPGRPALDAITGLRLNSDVPSAGTFACSNETMNRIQEMVLWTELSNLFSVQSDCPHREKFGYGGDIVAASEMGIFNFDMAAFYTKAVLDLADSVRPNGGFTETAPFVGISDEGLGEKSGPIGWGTAHPLLQAQLLQYYGDKRIIAEQYDRTMRWLELLKSQAREGILDNGISDHESIAPKPRALTGTGFYYMNARLAARLARALGKDSDARRAEELAEQIRVAFNRKFLDAQTGRYGEGTQASQAFALYLGLAPDEQRSRVLDWLVADIVQKNNGHLTTGIFGTKFMLNCLTDLGRADVAWQIASQKTFPGWGHMLENGATTLWEHWEFSDNTYSHNHPMFGSVSEWFYKGLAGIKAADDAEGFDRITIRPPAFAGLDWVKATYQSIRGPVSSQWMRNSKSFSMRVGVPVGVTAEVWVPASAGDNVTENGRALGSARGLKVLKRTENYAVVLCGSGDYRFESRSY